MHRRTSLNVTFTAPGKFLLACLLPVIGWFVWCFRSQNKPEDRQISLAVRDMMRTLLALRVMLPQTLGIRSALSLRGHLFFLLSWLTRPLFFRHIDRRPQLQPLFGVLNKPNAVAQYLHPIVLPLYLPTVNPLVLRPQATDKRITLRMQATARLQCITPRLLLWSIRITKHMK